MKNVRFNSLAFGSVAFILAHGMAFAAPQVVKMTPDQFRSTLLQQCQKTENCRVDEVKQYADGVQTQLERAQEHRRLLELGSVEGTIDEIIKRVEESGNQITQVTIRAGEKVVTVTGEQLDRLYRLPVVQSMVAAGEKTVSLTIEGLNYSYDLTVNLTKKIGIYQLTEVTVRTTYDYTTSALSHAAEGTIKAINYVMESRPVVLVVDGIEFVAKKIQLGNFAEKVGEYSWQAVEVFTDGAWQVAKFAYRGTMFVLGLPVEFVHWITRSKN